MRALEVVCSAQEPSFVPLRLASQSVPARRDVGARSPMLSRPTLHWKAAHLCMTTLMMAVGAEPLFLRPIQPVIGVDVYTDDGRHTEQVPESPW